MQAHRILIALLIAAVSLTAPFQLTAQNASWVTELELPPGSPSIDDATRVALAPTGDAILIGVRQRPNRARTTFLARVAADGSFLWQREDLPSEAPNKDAVGLSVTPSGDIVVLQATLTFLDSGRVLPSGVLSLHADDGTLRWSQELSRLDERMIPTGLARAHNGDLIVSAEQTVGSSGHTQGIVQRYDDNGTLLWSIEVRRGQRNRPLNVEVDAAGHSHVIGWTRPVLAGPAQLLYVVVNPRGLVVREVIVGSSNASLFPSNITLSPNGDIFVGGGLTTLGSTQTRAFAAKLGTNDFDWFTPLEGRSFDGGLALVPGGMRIVQGTTEIDLNGRLHTLLRVIDSATGVQLSTHGQFQPEATQEDVHDIAVRDATSMTAVGGVFKEGTFRPYVARKQLVP